MRSPLHAAGSVPVTPVPCKAIYFSAVSVPQLCGSVPVMLGLLPKEMRVMTTCDATETVAGTAGRLPTTPEPGRETETEVE